VEFSFTSGVEGTYHTQKDQAIVQINALLTKISGVSGEINETIGRIEALESAVDLRLGQLNKMRNVLAKQHMADRTKIHQYGQLRHVYMRTVDQLKRWHQARIKDRREVSELLTRAVAVQDNCQKLQLQVDKDVIGESMSNLVSLSSVMANDLKQQQSELKQFREKLDSASLVLKTIRIVPPPETKPKELPVQRRIEVRERSAAVDSTEDGPRPFVKCNPSLSSCRKWIFLRKKQDKLN
jgi:hypothetical protein